MAVKTKARFNIVDFILIALLILAVLAIFLRPAVIAQIGKLSANDTVIISFWADDVTKAQLDQIVEGDKFFYNDESFGELTSFTSSQAKTMQLIHPDSATEVSFFEKVTLPDRYTVKGQMRIVGSDREDGFFAGDKLYVGVGTVLYLKSDSYVLTVQITGIS